LTLGLKVHHNALTDRLFAEFYNRAANFALLPCPTLPAIAKDATIGAV
jgi:hypothetical protein